MKEEVKIWFFEKWKEYCEEDPDCPRQGGHRCMKEDIETCQRAYEEIKKMIKEKKR